MLFALLSNVPGLSQVSITSFSETTADRFSGGLYDPTLIKSTFTSISKNPFASVVVKLGEYSPATEYS